MAEAPTTSTTLLRDIGSDVKNARWGEFVERYRGMMTGYLKTYFPVLEADDIVQETLVALSQVLPNYRYDPAVTGHFHNYLTGILRNKACRECEHRAREKAIGPAEIVAAAQSLSGAETMSVDVEADEDSDVLLIKIDRILSPCENACAFHARLVRNLMRALAVKTIELNRKIEILSHRSTQDRLMAYLRSVAQQKGTAEFDIPFDRQQLADYLCVERSALSAEISRLSRLGLITSRKNHFTLRRAR